MITVKKLLSVTLVVLLLILVILFFNFHPKQELWYLLAYLVICGVNNIIPSCYMNNLSNLINDEIIYANQLKNLTSWNIVKIKYFIEEYHKVCESLDGDLSYINIFTIRHVSRIKKLTKEIIEYKKTRSLVGTALESENFTEEKKYSI